MQVILKTSDNLANLEFFLGNSKNTRKWAINLVLMQNKVWIWSVFNLSSQSDVQKNLIVSIL